MAPKSLKKAVKKTAKKVTGKGTTKAAAKPAEVLKKAKAPAAKKSVKPTKAPAKVSAPRKTIAKEPPAKTVAPRKSAAKVKSSKAPALRKVVKAKPAKAIAPRESAAKKAPTKASAGGTKLYTMVVYLLDGPITKAFAKKNEVVARAIEITGDETLHEFHRVIFKAYDRHDEHLYEFQTKGKGPNDPKARRFVWDIAEDMVVNLAKPSGTVKKTTIDALALKDGESFGYVFDFGDEWWHQILVAKIGKPQAGVRYPRVVQKIGDSPPQYAKGR